MPEPDLPPEWLARFRANAEAVRALVGAMHDDVDERDVPQETASPSRVGPYVVESELGAAAWASSMRRSTPSWIARSP